MGTHEVNRGGPQGLHEWKVRNMRTEDSQAAVAAADRAKVTTAVWLGRAIRQAIELERGALEGSLEVPEWRTQDTASPVANPQVTLEQLVTIAALKDTPKWLRTGTFRHIASTIQVSVPAGRPKKALAGPRTPAAETAGAGEGGL